MCTTVFAPWLIGNKEVCYSWTTFLINLILAKIRSEGKIALPTSGIAATLLTGDCTLHITFKIPLTLNPMDIPVCSIKRGTALCKIIQETKAIVVDAAPMTNRHAFEALDHTLRDLTGIDRSMGGICTLLYGDFSQILPVIPRGSSDNIVNACVNMSYLWDNVVVKHLNTNMRVYLWGDQVAEQFADQLLAIGDSKFSTDGDTDVVQVHDTMCTFVCNIDDLMSTRLAIKLYKYPRALYFGFSKQDHLSYQHNSGRTATWWVHPVQILELYSLYLMNPRQLLDF